MQRYHSNGRKKWGTKEPLDEGKRAGLKLNIQKTKIMASGHITSWQTEGEKEEAVTFYFLGLPNHHKTVAAVMKSEDAYFLEGKLWQA